MAKYEPLNKFLKNTRRHRRFAVEVMDIRIQAKTATETSAEAYTAKMINLGGVLIEGDRLLEPESTLLMEMTLPGNVPVSLTGRVTSCNPAKNKESRYEIGIEFVSMTEPDRTKLKKFIHWLYLKDAGFTE